MKFEPKIERQLAELVRRYKLPENEILRHAIELMHEASDYQDDDHLSVQHRPGTAAFVWISMPKRVI